ncbi:MAG: protein-L-isoaspartate(D-aspartate) O-methyltransferase [candidate division KSB1 bacterium]|nr:protein-L-isoaspartate(D-aspartate) O-methyltransferase [candidate division KSB1 bacterium]
MMKLKLEIILIMAMVFLCQGQTDMNDKKYQKQREEMIRKQLMYRGIEDKKVLDAFRQVKRHEFVPGYLRHFAYHDRPLPIGEGQTISQPYIVALMTELLQLSPKDTVLEIGTGSGYQAAILAKLCAHVYTIEINENLGTRAKASLDSLGYDNVSVKIGDGFKGWPEHAPFDAIIVTCSPEDVPPPLKEQLSNNGEMVIPVGSRSRQQLIVMKKKQDELIREKSIPVMFVPMVDSTGTRY